MFLSSELVELIVDHLSPEELIKLALLDRTHHAIMSRTAWWERYINTVYPGVKFSYAKLLEERKRVDGKFILTSRDIIYYTLSFITNLIREARSQFDSYQPKYTNRTLYKYFPVISPLIVVRHMWSGGDFPVQSAKYELHCPLSHEIEARQGETVLSSYQTFLHNKRILFDRIFISDTVPQEEKIETINKFLLSPMQQGYIMAPYRDYIGIPKNLVRNNPFFVTKEIEHSY